jgi:hypothetical protein
MVDKEARPDDMDGSSRDLNSVVTQFRTDLQRIQADMQGAGEPWGGDLLGMLIGEAHGIGFDSIFELYGELGDAMGDDADDLSRQAGNHRTAEDKSNTRVTDVGNQLV